MEASLKEKSIFASKFNLEHRWNMLMVLKFSV